MIEQFKNQEFTLHDFMRMILPQELKRASGKSILVISDFDETLCSKYVFSQAWETHVPIINSDLQNEAQELKLPMCIATARTPIEPVSWVVWNKLTKIPMPLIAENGAVLVWPERKIKSTPDVQVLATGEQIKLIKQIQQELEENLIKNLVVPECNHIVLRTGRAATVELRAENKTTRKGTPEDYINISKQLQKLFPEAMDLVEIVCSGSSLGIQPKGISKSHGIEAALMLLKIQPDELFMLGLGDNTNDKPLFDFVRAHNGITIGVRPSSKGLCDFTVDGGDMTSLAVLKQINKIGN